MNEGNGPAEPGMPSTNGARLITAMVWPTIILLGLIMMSSAAIVAAAFFSPAGELGKLLGQAHAISRLVALVIIVPSLVVLTILDKCTGEVAATALSAIAGYILGSTGGQ
jgi:hypothetical protein